MLTRSNKVDYTWAMDESVRFRCDTEDKEKFEAAAKSAKMPLSKWIRQQLVKAAEKAARAKG